MITFLRDFKLPLILISEIIICLLFADYIPVALQQHALSISLGIKEILIFLLPFIIFSFLGNSIGTLQQGAFRYVILVFSMVLISNFMATVIGGGLGILTLEKIGFVAPSLADPIGLVPSFTFELTPLFHNDIALLIGLIAGVTVSLFKSEGGRKALFYSYTASMVFLKKVFIPLLPLFILGFVFKMESDGTLSSVFKNYLPIALMIVVIAVTCITLVLFYACDFKIAKVRSCVRNLIPAMITGFTTMSSASTLPLVVDAVTKNTSDESTPGVVPISINAHLIGDCFSMSMQAMAILIAFGYPLPDLMTFLTFALFFAIARFAVAGIPGGGVIVILGVFETYLGFNFEMLSLITALYILFDPLITLVNVLGHGTFAQLFEKFYRKIK